MTDRELMQQALDALKNRNLSDDETVEGNAIKALRAALAQPEQEPVAWGIANTRPTERQRLMMVMLDEPEPSHLVVPLYTAPPQREWQGLTDEEIKEAGNLHVEGKRMLPYSFARAIEAKLKAKNA